MAKARSRATVRRARPLGPKAKRLIQKLYWGRGGVPRTTMRAISDQLGIGVWQVYAAIRDGRAEGG